MLHYTKLQLITVIIVPIAVIVLLWTVGIFQQNRKRWRCYDSAVVAILLQSVVRDVAVVVYTILQVVSSDADGTDRFNYCVVFVWILSWAHTFQVSFNVRRHNFDRVIKMYAQDTAVTSGPARRS